MRSSRRPLCSNVSGRTLKPLHQNCGPNRKVAGPPALPCHRATATGPQRASIISVPLQILDNLSFITLLTPTLTCVTTATEHDLIRISKTPRRVSGSSSPNSITMYHNTRPDQVVCLASDNGDTDARDTEAPHEVLDHGSTAPG